MASPFQRIILDGLPRQGEAILHWSAELAERHSDAPWTRSLGATLRELVTGSGALAARTSGTTGPPKPMTVPADDLIASARLTAATFGLKEGDRALLCLPCDFIAGKLMLVRAFVSGLDLQAIDPSGSVLGHLPDDRSFHFAALVPQQLHQAIGEDRARTERLFDTVLLGGGPVSAVLAEALQGLRTRVFHGYGSTEMVTHVALRALNGPDAADHFTALGTVRFAVDDRGCLVVHTPHLRTTEHRTNDVVELLDDRRFRWLGRSDNVILSGGKKLFPEALEARTAAVVPVPHFFAAMPDERLGQCTVLVLEAAPLTPEEEAALLTALERVLTKHERPKRILTLRSFRRTSSGKVVRSLE